MARMDTKNFLLFLNIGYAKDCEISANIETVAKVTGFCNIEALVKLFIL
jgi:hypothetical protein